ncbi:methyltransferase domain-containing protein [Enterovirga sp. GCM10030262]|uniref:methyltransferase domain-containing protein n=1 Tax=Enterovirga sp. GCM10030262 TaxID=3273391 RepID=UPI003623444C
MKGADFLPLCLLSAAFALGGCRAEPERSPFPDPERPVAPIVSPRYSNEDARDSIGEFESVVELAGIAPGMSVADIGAGEGYYTVRLAPLVGDEGRVLAQDIVPETRDALAQRVTRERLDNVAVKLGLPNNPMLPETSFDRILLIHMYHEVQRPAEFLWHVRGALKRDGSVVVVDADRPTDRHGTPPKMLLCEFVAVGYELVRFERLADSGTYFAQFKALGPRPEPEQIPICPA